MSKYKLIKPDLHTGYLNDGKGQEVTYLKIPELLTVKDLESDIKNGATHFTATREYLKERPSRFTIINCSDEESGLNAVSYIASVYNRLDNLAPENYEDDDSLDDFQFNFDEDDEYEEEDEWSSDMESSDDCGQEEWEGDNAWSEHPWKIPVVSMSQILSCGGNSFNPFFMGGVSMGGMNKPRNDLPFWYYTRKESICITYDIGRVGIPFGANAESFIRVFKRYSNNRHVYFLVYSSEESSKQSSFRIVLDSEEDDSDSLDMSHQMISNIILEYCAGCVDVIQDEASSKEYYTGILRDLVEHYGCKLKDNIPKEKFSTLISSTINPNKADFLEKVVKFVIKQHPNKKVLDDKDFDILGKFKLIGTEGKQAEKKSIVKLDRLVGMDSVKAQINGVVQVMKYQKQRKKLGLPGNNYHNVHLMLGAPGTAKTTIAEILGNMMADEKLLHGARFISVNGAELKGMYVGHSAPKVKALFDQYDIILIDEAYAIAAGGDGDTDSFSQEAIAQLIIELEKHGMDRLVIFAGYGGEKVSQKDNRMKDFLNANPGIRSRINSTIFFDSYTPDEMVKIFRHSAKMAEYRVPKSADKLVREFFTSRFKCEDFGNGREARSLLENSIMEAAIRLAVSGKEITLEEMKELKIEDISKAISKMSDATRQQGGMVASKYGFAM